MIKLKKFVIVISLKENLCVKRDADEEEKDMIKDVDKKEVVKKNLNEKKVVIEENVVIEEMIKKEVVKNDITEEKVVIKDVA